MLDNIQLLPDVFQDPQCPRQFFTRMSGGHDGADASLALGHRRETDALRKHPGSEKLTREFVRQCRVTDDDGGDGCFAQAGIEAQFLQSLFEESRVRPELLDQLRLLFQDFKGGEARGGDRRGVGSGEQEWPSTMVKKLNGVAGGANVAAQRSDGLRERSNLDVHAAVQVEVIDRAAPVPSEHGKRGRRRSS